MASTTFTDGGQAVYASWLNDVNSNVYDAAGGITGSIARTAQEKFSDVVSVKDFGAVGDGITDDTAAIQAAFNYAFNTQISVSASPVFYGCNVKIYFPFGRYLTSSPIVFSTSYSNIEGDRAILVKASSFSGTAAFAWASSGWQAIIKGLQFIGYNQGLNIDSNNTDTGKVTIEECDFQNITGYAAYVTCRSSFVEFKNCRWVNCVHELYIAACDRLVINGGWIKRGVLANNYDAGIINYGTLMMRDVLGVPAAQSVTEPAWVNNYYVFRAYNCRFGGETGSMTAVNNFAPGDSTYPIIPTEVSIYESDVYTVNSPTAAIRLFEVPNVIRFNSSLGLVDSDIVKFSPSVTPSAKMTAAPYYIVDINYNGIFGSHLTNGLPTSFNSVLIPYLSYKSGLPKWQNVSYVENSQLQSPSVSGGNGTFTYDFIQGNDPAPNFIIEYFANPNVGGSGSYRGKYIGILSIVTGFNSVVVRQAYLTSLYNNTAGSSPSTYTVTLTWAATSASGASGLALSNPDTRLTLSFNNTSTGASANYRILQLGTVPYLL